MTEETNSRVEYGRAFWTNRGSELFVASDTYDTYEEAVEYTSLRWDEHPYDFVVKRTVTDWEVCVE